MGKLHDDGAETLPCGMHALAHVDTTRDEMATT